ncbi:MAG: periplasmic heavy metal sensor [Alphaproteobacteria bacterium]
MSEEPNAFGLRRRRWRRPFRNATPWLIGALAVSLAINAFVIGAFVGERWRGAPHRHFEFSDRYWLSPLHGYSIRRLGGLMEAETRAKLREVARPHRAQLKLLLAEAAEARLDALDAMTAPEFDAEVLEQAFARARDAETAAVELTQEIIAEAAARFTPEERAAVHEALRQRMDLWRERVERRRKRLEKWQKRLEQKRREERKE